jgi:hypothetical protein
MDANMPGPAKIQSESYAPFVTLTIAAQNLQITVGNNSLASSGNTAAIKSFDIGWINTIDMSAEIVDEEGGRMGLMLDSLRKCAAAGVGSEILAQWGWVHAGCGGEKGSPIRSLPVRATITGLEVSYSEGKIKYKLTATGNDPVFVSIKEFEPYGEWDKKISLEEAIKRICAEKPEMKVFFCRRERDGTLRRGSTGSEVGWVWKGYAEGGPKGVWPGTGKNKIEVIQRWISDYCLIDGGIEKGIIITIDSLNYDELNLIMDPTPGPGEFTSCGNNRLGTFIVNGGKCSNVIEFNPRFNWLQGRASFSNGGTGGFTDSTETVDVAESKDQMGEGSDTESTGQHMTLSADANVIENKQSGRELTNSRMAHLHARKSMNSILPIEAELKIMGDPRPQFVAESMWRASNVSIVAINPFHLRASGSECGDWSTGLAGSACNRFLSNKEWLVLGLSHSIREGSYTTTLKLYLPAQHIDLNPNDPMGGLGSGGSSVEVDCSK